MKSRNDRTFHLVRGGLSGRKPGVEGLPSVTNRPRLIRRLYTELRRAVGSEATGRELLEAARAIAETAYPVNNPKANGFRSHAGGGLPFDCWDLDRAMADGGWKIMNYENDLASYSGDDSFDSHDTRISFQHWMRENAA